MYRNLNAERIVDTTRALQRRIAERFPESSLSRVAAELLSVAEQAAAVSQWLARPHVPLRILCVTLSAVNEVEALATGLSQKIWQKIVILDRVAAPEGGRTSPAPKTL